MRKKEDILRDGMKTRFSSTYQPKKNGRQKGSLTFASHLKKYLNKKITLENPLTGEKERKEAIEHLIIRLVAKGLNGDLGSIKEMINRIDGKAIENISIDGNINYTKEKKELGEAFNLNE